MSNEYITNQELVEFIRNHKTTLHYLLTDPCDWYFNVIMARHGRFKEFNPFELIVEKARKDFEKSGLLERHRILYRLERDTVWLINNSKQVMDIARRCHVSQFEDIMRTECTREGFFIPQDKGE